jgi:hypothetical protein
MKVFAAGVMDTGGKVSTIPVVMVANLLPVSSIPVVHLDLQISARIFKKNRNHERNQKQKIS